MLPRLVFLSALAILLGALVDDLWASALAALAIALLPGLLFAIPQRGRFEGWVVALSLSLLVGMAGLLFPLSGWIAGLPIATWWVWIFLGALPFGLTIYGTVVRRPSEDRR